MPCLFTHVEIFCIDLVLMSNSSKYIIPIDSVLISISNVNKSDALSNILLYIESWHSFGFKTIVPVSFLIFAKYFLNLLLAIGMLILVSPS